MEIKWSQDSTALLKHHVSAHPGTLSLCCATSLGQSKCQSSPTETQGTLQLSPFLGERPSLTGCIH